MSRNNKSKISIETFEEKPEEVVELVEEENTAEVEKLEPILREAIDVKHVKDNVRLRVRQEPKVADNVLRELQPNEEVKIYDLKDGWALISEDLDEYVMADFLV